MIGFMVTLALTFEPNLVQWNGIETYVSGFNPLQVLATVFSSIIIAISFVIFTVCVHYYADDEKKIWSHLSIVFGLMYAIISMANYLIQIIAVVPSIESNNINGLDILVAGYPNSIFYALMASYFFMCISTMFAAFVFNNEKGQKGIKILFIASVLSIPLCVACMVLGLGEMTIIAGIIWLVCLVLGFLKTAVHFRRLLKKH
jgi:hypothetical protein